MALFNKLNWSHNVLLVSLARNAAFPGESPSVIVLVGVLSRCSQASGISFSISRRGRMLLCNWNAPVYLSCQKLLEGVPWLPTRGRMLVLACLLTPSLVFSCQSTPPSCWPQHWKVTVYPHNQLLPLGIQEPSAPAVCDAFSRHQAQAVCWRSSWWHTRQWAPQVPWVLVRCCFFQVDLFWFVTGNAELYCQEVLWVDRCISSGSVHYLPTLFSWRRACSVWGFL